MSIKYPYRVDDNISLPDVIDDVTPVQAETVNRLKQAILAIEKEMGVKPSGVRGTIKDRFISLENVIQSLTIGTGVFAPGGDLTGSETNQTVVGIRGTPISDTPPIMGQALIFDGTYYVPGTVGSGGGGGGDFVAGGDLGGTSTSQSVLKVRGISYAAGPLTPGNVAVVIGSNSVSYIPLNLSNINSVSGILPATNLPAAGAGAAGIIQLANDLSGTSSLPVVSGLRGVSIANVAPTINQILQFNGTSWTPSTFTYTPSDATTGARGVIQLAGDLGGTATSPSVLKLRGVSISGTTPTTNQYLIFDGTSWTPGTLTFPDASTSAKGLVRLAGDIGGTSTSVSVIKLQGTSLSATIPTTNQVLQFNGSSWQPATLAAYTPVDANSTTKGIVQLTGDFSGVAGNPIVAGLRGNPISITTPLSGQILKYDGTTWNSVDEYFAPDASATTKGLIQLTGDLDGTSSSPLVSKLQGTSISNASPGTNQVLQYNGTAWAPGTLPVYAPTSATYLTLTSDGVLTDERILTAGTNISFADAGPGGTFTINNTYVPTDANASSKGVIQLTNDLGGTSSSPLVIGLQGISVSGTTPTTNQVLQYNGTNWIPSTLSAYTPTDATTSTKGIIQLAGDIGGTASGVSVIKLNGTNIAATVPTTNQILQYNGSAWSPSTLAASAPISASYLTLNADATLTSERVLTAGTNISFVDGGAGNNLTINSTYTYTPVDATTLSKGVIQIAGDIDGTATAISVAKIRGTNVSSTAPTSNQVLQYVGTSWTPSTLPVQAPTSASYLTLSLDGTLTNERVLTAGTNISFTDGGANGNLTINNTYTPTDASTSVKGIFQLTNDLGGTASSPSVLKINGIAASGTPAIGYALLATSTSAATWQALPTYTPTDATTGAKGVVQLAGDLGGIAGTPSVLKVNGTTYPAGGTLTTGNVAIVSGTGAVSYGSLNLALAATVGSSVLPAVNMTNASTSVIGTIKLANDLGGTAALPTVIRINGTSVSATSTTGQVLRATASNTASWGAIDLTSSAAVSGILPAANHPDASTSAKGILQLTKDLGGTALLPTVIGLQGRSVSSISPTDGYVLTWSSGSSNWYPAAIQTAGSVSDASTVIKGIVQLAGDIGGTASSVSVLKVNSVSYSAGGSLTIGSIPRVTGVSTVSYGALDLANSNAVTGLLPNSNQSPQSLSGDLSGTTATATVIKLQGTSVSNTAPTTSQVLQYNGTSWIPATLSAYTPVDATTSVKGIIQLNLDLGGTAGSPSVIGLQGRSVSNLAPTDGYVLTWSSASSNWYPAINTPIIPDATSLNKGIIQLANDLGGSANAPTVLKINGATVPTSGSLVSGNILKVSGTSALSYGTLDLSNANSISGVLPSANMTNASTSVIGTIKLAQDLGGTAALPNVIGLQGIAISNVAPTTNQILQYNGTQWAAATFAGSDATLTAKGVIQLAGDLGGTATAPSVLKLRGASVGLGTSLTTGTILRATGTATADWGALNLSNANAITGFLTAAYLDNATTSVKGVVQLTGDIGGTATNVSVLKINGTSVPAGGTLTSGTILQATGIASSSWSALDLSNANSITGILPAGNMTNASTSIIGTIKLAQDLGGTAALPNVIGIRGVSVSATLPTTNQVLQYNGTVWAPSTFTYTAPDATTTTKGIVQLAGDIAGTTTSVSVVKIQGTTISSTAPTSNQVLQYVGTSWTPTSLPASAPISASYITLGTDATLTSERVLTAGTNISIVDGGANGNVTINNTYVPVDSSTSVKGIIQLSRDLGGTAALPNVIGLQGRNVSSLAPNDGYVLTWSNAASNWYPASTQSIATPDATTFSKGIVQLAGDMGGTAIAPSVLKINSASVPAAGALTLGNTLQVSGTSSLSYGPINLGGGSNYVSGILPSANQASQTLSGDLSGSTASATVIKLQNVAVSNTAPSTNQVLQYNGTTWTPTTLAAYTPTDATTSVKGIIQLSGDLGGTAAAPSVLKINATSVSAGGALVTGTVLRATGLSTSAWGALDLANSSAITGLLPTANQVSQSLTGDLSGTTASATVIKVNGASYPAAGSLVTGTIPRVTGLSTVSYGALDLANTSAVTGILPVGNLPNASTGALGVIQLTNDLGGTATAPAVLKINGISITGTPSTGYVPTATSGTAATWQAPTTGAPVGASYLTLGTDATLTSERVLTAGTNISFTDAGAGSTLTINSTYTYTPTDATTLAKGIVQLSGDLGGTAALPSVLKINGISVSNTAATGQVLTATGTTAATWQAPTTFTAGGDLTGTNTSQTVAKVNGTSYPAGGALTTGTIPRVTGISTVAYGALDLTNANAVSGILPAANHPDAATGAKGIVQLAGDLAGTSTSVTVAKINGISISGTPALGYIPTATSATAATWQAPTAYVPTDASTTVKGVVQLAGDISGTATSVVVSKINAASVPVAGTLVTGNVLQVSGTSALSYGAINLAGGANYVSGILPIGNQASQTLGGDLSGTTAAGTVIKLQGTAVSATAPTTNQLLQYNGTSWIPTTVTITPADATTTTKGIIQLAGDMGGTAAAPSVLKINGTSVSATAAVGQVLRATGANTSGWGAIDLTSTAAVSGILPSANLFAATTTQAGSVKLAGDLGGTSALPTVLKINNTSITTAGGTLTTEAVLRVTGTGSADWGPINLANSAAVTGTLQATNLPLATTLNRGALVMTGDLGGSGSAPTVLKLNGTTITTAGGGLAAGQVLRATSVGVADWGSLNLANSSAVTGVLPAANIAVSTTTTNGGITLAGDLGGTGTTPSVLKINGISASATASAGQVLTATSATAATWQTPATYTPTDATTGAKGIVQLAKDLGGTAALPTVIGIQGIPVVSTAPTANQFLQYVGTSWVPNTYAPPLASNSNNGSILLAGDLSGSNNSTNPVVSGIRGVNITNVAPTTNQILKYDGTNWLPSAVPSATSSLVGGILLTGELGGTATAPTVLKINGVSLPGTLPTVGQVLTATTTTSATWVSPGGTLFFSSYYSQSGNVSIASTTSVEIGVVSLFSLAVGDVIDVMAMTTRDGTTGDLFTLQITNSGTATVGSGTVYQSNTAYIGGSTPVGGSGGMPALFTVTTAGAHYIHMYMGKSSAGNATFNCFQRRIAVKVFR